MNERLKKAKELLKRELERLTNEEQINSSHFSWKFHKHKILYRIWNDIFETLPMRDERGWLELEDIEYTNWLKDLGGENNESI